MSLLNHNTDVHNSSSANIAERTQAIFLHLLQFLEFVIKKRGTSAEKYSQIYFAL